MSQQATSQAYSSRSGEHAKLTFSDRMVARLKGAWPKFSTELSSAEYGESFDDAERRFGQSVVNQAVDVAKLRFRQDEVPSIADLIQIMQDIKSGNDSPNYGDAKHLYDDPCRFGCMNGWRNIPFDELPPARKNKLLEVYKTLEKAREHTQVARCECWRGPK